MNLIPDDIPLLGQLALGFSYGTLALAVTAVVVYWLVRLLIVAPPEVLERAYANARGAPGTEVPLNCGGALTVFYGGRHSPHVIAARRAIETSAPTVLMEAVDERGGP